MSNNNSEYPTAEKKKGCCCLWGCGISCLGLLLAVIIGGAVFYFYCLKGKPLKISPETTIITDVKKTDGKRIDFFRVVQELTQPQIAPPDANGFKDVLKEYGRKMCADEEQYAAMCKHFDLKEQWLTVFNPSIDVIADAAMKPQYFVPMVRQSEADVMLFSYPMTVYEFHGHICRELRERARYKFDAGKIDEGWKDYLATLRLFRSVTIFNALLPSRSEILDAEFNEWMLQFDDFKYVLAKLTPEQKARFARDLDALPAWQDRKITLRVLQFSILDVIAAMDNNPALLDSFSWQVANSWRWQESPMSLETPPLSLLNYVGFDWNLITKNINEQFKNYSDALDKAGDDKEKQWQLFTATAKKSAVALSYTETGITVAGRSQGTAEFVGAMFMASVSQMFKMQLEEEKRCNGLKAVLLK